MPKVRLLAPIENHGTVNEVVEVDDATAKEWHAAGKASYMDDEKRSEEAAAHGHYGDVTGREDTAPLGGGPVPGPSAPREEDDDEEEEPPRKGKK